MPYIFKADIEFLIWKIDNCKNNPEISSIRKTRKHAPCGYSMSTIWAFDHIENRHSLYSLHRWKDWIKRFCECLREHPKNIIDLKRKKMLSLTKKD